MHALLRDLIVCVGVACAGVATAAPKQGKAAPKAAPAAKKASAADLYAQAQKAYNAGEYVQARDLARQGLAIAPKDRNLLLLHGTVLIKLFDNTGALAAYQAYVDSGVGGAQKRDALEIIANLKKVETTFLEITVENGPAKIYLDSSAQGLLCDAAPTCKTTVFPRRYTVIAERAGFEPKAGSVRGVVVAPDKTTAFALTLVEKPSPVAVRVAQPEAVITVDGAPYTAGQALAAGSHEIVVTLAGHAEERRTVKAALGAPIDLDIALSPIVPARVRPATATLRIGGKPIALKDGGLAIPAGEQVLVVSAPGHRDREVKVPAQRTPQYEIVVELEVERAAPPPIADKGGTFTGRRKLALAAGGVAVLAVGAGALLGVQSGGLDDDAYALCPDPAMPCGDAQEANDLNQRARSRATQANIAFGVAGGAAIAAAILWFTGAPESRSRMAISPHVGPQGGGLDVSVRF